MKPIYNSSSVYKIFSAPSLNKIQDNKDNQKDDA